MLDFLHGIHCGSQILLHKNFHIMIITTNYNYIATRLATTICIMVPDYLPQYV
jgi:hypothetical protein